MHGLPLLRAARRRRRRLLALLVPAAAVAAFVAGCGGGSSYGAGAAAKAPAPATRGGATVVTRHTSLGTILTDGQGRTLYLFEKDKGPMSTCDGSCASIWPPLTTSGRPHAGTGVAAAKLATSKRPDGTTEVTYGGHPLYTYAGDSRPGATAGQNLDQFGAEWYVVAPQGTAVEHG